MKRVAWILGLLVAAAGVLAAFCVGVLDQREIAFRTLLNDAEFELGGVRLNEPILDEPGLYLRLPGIHQVHVYDRRLLRYDARPQNAYTSGQDLVLLDYYAMWRLEDPRRFYEAFRQGGIEAARSRIDNTTYGKLRNELARHALGDLLSERREEIVDRIARDAAEELARQGIRIVDLRIRGLAYPEQNLDAVYRRMRSERERYALRARAEGEEQARTIRSEADETVRITLAQAERDAERLRGEGDAEATAIYAEAYGKDPEFYAFTRSLEAYRKALDEQTTLVLSPEVSFLRYLFEMRRDAGLPPVSAPAATP